MTCENLSTGVDLIDTEIIGELVKEHGKKFLDRVFTPAEQRLCGNNIASLAGRFAAKEAVGKALGSGIGFGRWKEIEILEDALGKPVVTLSGLAQQRAAERNLRFAISIAHGHGKNDHLAIAFVIAM